jgi:hypothetical protein
LADALLLKYRRADAAATYCRLWGFDLRVDVAN